MPEFSDFRATRIIYKRFSVNNMRNWQKVIGIKLSEKGNLRVRTDLIYDNMNAAQKKVLNAKRFYEG